MLTRSEHRILQLVLSFQSNKEIAQTVGTTERTAKFHVHNIFSKYGVHSRAELFSKLYQPLVLRRNDVQGFDVQG